MKTIKLLGLMMLLFLTNQSVSQSVSTTFFVDGVCGMCEERIEKAVSVKGVSSAEWDVDSRILSITYDSSSVKLIELHQRIAKVGHDTELVKATQEDYDNVHGCCKYRDEEVKEVHQPEVPTPDTIEESVVLKGRVLEIGENGKRTPVYSANVFWLETMNGVTTDEKGYFEISKGEKESKLIVSYVGTTADSLEITDESNIEIILSNSIKLRGFTVIERRKGIEISKLNVIKMEGMNRKELAKAACCNLSESFETNPSVDVSYTDAVTGTKQIQMLGLSGANIQITKELLPDIRGFSSVYGMNFVPGDWIESIQLAKGVGSVMNGYESIAGQINVEIKKPDESERFNVNLYANQGGRQEFNTNFKIKLNEKWSTGFLLHSSVRTTENDVNADGFLDMPMMQNFIGINRWKFNNDSTGWMGQIGIEGVSLKNVGGQKGFRENQTMDTLHPWGATTEITRARGWFKMGKVFKESPGKSIGLQVSASDYNQISQFGLTTYKAKQTSGYANLIFQNIIKTTDHSYFVGASVLMDDYKESIDTTSYDRLELTPGVYGEYSYSGGKKFNAVVGARADYSNLFGFFFTPRIHLKYDLNEKTILRLAAGRGQRTANIFGENQGLFATSRTIRVNGDPNKNTPYGLQAEVAWNIGVNLVRDFDLAGREGMLSVDLYRTQFQNQIVVDWENPNEISFYNLQGISFSNSLQVQLDYELLPLLDVRLAYRYYDIKTTYNEVLLQKQLVARNRAFVNFGYETKSEWKFDFTLNWIGEQRIASTSSNPELFQYRDKSPSYFLSNAQITKVWSKKFSTYIGGENIFDFRQDRPIIDSENPFGNNFESSLVWAPIFGRNIYVGLRYTIE